MKIFGFWKFAGEDAYKDLSEDSILGELHEICDEPFMKTKDYLTSMS